MHSEFLFDEELSSISTVNLGDSIGKIVELKSTNDELEKLLEDNKWQGEAHDKCAAAIKMMEKFRADLESLCDELKKYIENAVVDASDFVDNSDKIESIKKV